MARYYQTRSGGRWRWRYWCALMPAAACSAALAAAAIAQPEPAQPPQGDQEQDEELSERLIRQATGQQEGDIMDEIMALMARSARLLVRDFDPGPPTQVLQGQIIEKLDEAIASAQRRRARSGASARPAGDKRTAPPKPREDTDSAGEAAGDQPPEGTVATKGEAQRTGTTGRFRESRRGWGHLPARDRDEVLQGIDEDVLEKYRDLVESYFRALAEDDQE